jgi:hypothetical protein
MMQEDQNIRKTSQGGPGNSAEPEKKTAAGPLMVSELNPRYFAVVSENVAGKVIYLTGSHINNNLQDGMGPGKNCSKNPERFDYEAYLKFLKDHGHNFIRLWRWEQFRGQLITADIHLCMSPQPWLRTGPGEAKDGKPKFDLTKFDENYFDRLRNRIIRAGKEGIYVSAMLFEGFSLHLTATPDNIEGHPFHALNNTNHIGIESIIDYQVFPIDPRIQELQENYIRKFVDTVQDLPNVLYEVSNESSGDKADAVTMPDGSTIDTPIGDSTDWQCWVVNFIKDYEQQMDYQKHPVGMTYQYPVADQLKANDRLWSGPADWVSPGFDEGKNTKPTESRWLIEPPVNEGKKIVISDTDHYAPMGSDPAWAWKSFMRGHHPILYDLGILGGFNPPDPSAGNPAYNSLEPTRYAMGDTLKYAQNITLAEMRPFGALSSTDYVLASRGKEYLVFNPDPKAESLKLAIEPGVYAVEWYGINSRKTSETGKLVVDKITSVELKSPFDPSEQVVVHIKIKS